jgi:hypothetical protein
MHIWVLWFIIIGDKCNNERKWIFLGIQRCSKGSRIVCEIDQTQSLPGPPSVFLTDEQFAIVTAIFRSTREVCQRNRPFFFRFLSASLCISTCRKLDGASLVLLEAHVHLAGELPMHAGALTTASRMRRTVS